MTPARERQIRRLLAQYEEWLEGKDIFELRYHDSHRLTKALREVLEEYDRLRDDIAAKARRGSA